MIYPKVMENKNNKIKCVKSSHCILDDALDSIDRKLDEQVLQLGD